MNTSQLSSVMANGHVPTIAIFCENFIEGGETFNSDYYWQAYQDLYLALKARGIRVYFVSDNTTYRGGGVFDVAYSIEAKTTLDSMTEVRDVQVDLVFNRGNFAGTDILKINPKSVQILGHDKIEMYKHFAEFQPFSIICNDKAAVVEAFTKINDEKVVVKDPEGDCGKEVYIGDKQEVLGRLPDQYPVLVQEFMDTSAGIPGLLSGVHDVRLSVCGGDIIGYYVRQAKEGSYLSNVSQGGKMAFFDVEQVPAEVAVMAHEIDRMFGAHPRYYAIDFMLTPKGWKMLELNSLLALLPITDGIEAEKTLNRLADYLVKVCNDLQGQVKLGFQD